MILCYEITKSMGSKKIFLRSNSYSIIYWPGDLAKSLNGLRLFPAKQSGDCNSVSIKWINISKGFRTRWKQSEHYV